MIDLPAGHARARPRKKLAGPSPGRGRGGTYRKGPGRSRRQQDPGGRNPGHRPKNPACRSSSGPAGWKTRREISPRGDSPRRGVFPRPILPRHTPPENALFRMHLTWNPFPAISLFLHEYSIPLNIFFFFLRALPATCPRRVRSRRPKASDTPAPRRLLSSYCLIFIDTIKYHIHEAMMMLAHILLWRMTAKRKRYRQSHQAKKNGHPMESNTAEDKSLLQDAHEKHAHHGGRGILHAPDLRQRHYPLPFPDLLQREGLLPSRIPRQPPPAGYRHVPDRTAEQHPFPGRQPHLYGTERRGVPPEEPRHPEKGLRPGILGPGRRGSQRPPGGLRRAVSARERQLPPRRNGFRRR